MFCPEGMENVKVVILDAPTQEDWDMCKRITVGTMGYKNIKTSVDSEWKKKMLIAEHSPIRALTFLVEFQNLPSYVATHLVRHHVGTTPFIESQRNDRQEKYDRRKAPQDAPVLARFHMNIQAILNMSHARLCKQASIETQYAWWLFLDELEKIEPEVSHACVPKCIYRNGLCGEFHPCTGLSKPKVSDYPEFFAMFKKGDRDNA